MPGICSLHLDAKLCLPSSSVLPGTSSCCSSNAFHLWPFQADISPVGCAAASCGRLSQETSHTRRKHHTPPCLVIQLTAQQTMAVTMVLHHKSASCVTLWLTHTFVSSLFQFWLLSSAVGMNGVFLCLENLLRDLPAEAFQFWPKPIMVCYDLLTLSQWNGLVAI